MRRMGLVWFGFGLKRNGMGYVKVGIDCLLSFRSNPVEVAPLDVFLSLMNLSPFLVHSDSSESPGCDLRLFVRLLESPDRTSRVVRSNLDLILQ